MMWHSLFLDVSAAAWSVVTDGANAELYELREPHHAFSHANNSYRMPRHCRSYNSRTRGRPQLRRSSHHCSATMLKCVVGCRETERHTNLDDEHHVAGTRRLAWRLGILCPVWLVPQGDRSVPGVANARDVRNTRWTWVDGG